MTTLTEIYEQRGDWYIGYVEELPGANVQEHTLDEARKSLKEAVALIMETKYEEKIALMQKAATDPLYLADMEEINNDFSGV